MINILIPMAGRGKRFSDVGFSLPKPLIEFNGKAMIEHVVKNVVPKKEEYRFIYIFLRDHVDFGITNIFKNIEKDYSVNSKYIAIQHVTDGSARTCLSAKEFINNDEELLIVNSDQIVEDLDHTDNSINFYRKRNADGGILCFLNDSPKWSYVRINGDKIIQTVEKEVVSNIATVGIYYFKHGKYFVDAAQRMISNKDKVNGEYYTCPIYNYMIADDKKIVPYMINSMCGLGTPTDLAKYLRGLNENL